MEDVMKNLTFVIALVLTLGVAVLSFAGNNPALSYPAGVLALAQNNAVLDEATPWHKEALHYAAGIVKQGVWYAYCPAAGKTHFITTKAQFEVALLNGKKIMLCCVTCKEDVEKNPAKFSEFMY